ncbi:MAG TPA: oligopeptide transporter, OPT family [Azospirillaceae bacterium]|nr:oligopeptide transporter, OPT family [Azospirillaceae bacterium]
MNLYGNEEIKELTIRSVILGALITVVFTAANVYLGLKVGLTIASAIPAAVISMAVLKLASDSNIRENTTVQTIASAAGTLSSIIFVLPGLIIVGYWQDFPFWQSALVCAIGGILGVMYTVPLRRAMVVEGGLPYPEGVAAAEVLKVGSPGMSASDQPEHDERQGTAGLKDIVAGTLASTGFAIVKALGIFGGEVVKTFTFGTAVTRIGTELSLPLIGVGILVGMTVGISQFIGVIIAWGVAVPILTAQTPPPEGVELAQHATTIWRTQVRFIGAGSIAVAAVWTLILLSRPMVEGIRSSIAAMKTVRTSGSAGLPRVERDIPFNWVVGVSLATLIPMAALVAYFIGGTGEALASKLILLTVVATLFAAVIGFAVGAASGYMAGLIGSSNSPVSSISIVSVIIISAILVGILSGGGLLDQPDVKTAAIALALFATSIVLAVATVANDNLQDLKTGQLVGATPWRQETALVIGVIVGAIVIPPVLDLLNSAYGFAGAPNATDRSLAAPQATLMSSIAQGILGGGLNWKMLGYGAVVGVILVAVDEMLRRSGGKYRLPPLAVSIGIYLPLTTTIPVTIGAFVAYFVTRTLKARADAAGQDYERFSATPLHRGVLLASGLIVGESLFGVVLAGLIVGSGNDAPLAVVSDFHLGETIGGIAFLAALYGAYRWIIGKKWA